MTTLVECWNKLEGNVGELSSWVDNKEPAAQFDEKAVIPIEKLEGQLNQLKVMFEEKQKLVADLEAYGATEEPQPAGEENGKNGEAEQPAEGEPTAPAVNTGEQ